MIRYGIRTDRGAELDVFRSGGIAAPRGGVINRPEVLALFTRQHWVASRRPAAGHPGVDGRHRPGRRTGTLVNVLPGVVRLAGTAESFVSRAMALQLHVGDNGLPQRRQCRRLCTACVACPSTRSSTAPANGARWSCRRGPRSSGRAGRSRDATSRSVLTGCASPPAADAVPPRPHVQRSSVRAGGRGLLAPQAGHPGRRRRLPRRDPTQWTGRRDPFRALARLRTLGAPAAEPERPRAGRDRRRSVRAGLPEPERQHPLTLRTGEVIHVDAAWPEARLGVEPGHSWWHGGDLRQRADQARDRACDEIGWRIVRHDESVRDELAGVRPAAADHLRRAASIARGDAVRRSIPRRDRYGFPTGSWSERD